MQSGFSAFASNDGDIELPMLAKIQSTTMPSNNYSAMKQMNLSGKDPKSTDKMKKVSVMRRGSTTTDKSEKQEEFGLIYTRSAQPNALKKLTEESLKFNSLNRSKTPKLNNDQALDTVDNEELDSKNLDQTLEQAILGKKDDEQLQDFVQLADKENSDAKFKKAFKKKYSEDMRKLRKQTKEMRKQSKESSKHGTMKAQKMRREGIMMDKFKSEQTVNFVDELQELNS